VLFTRRAVKTCAARREERYFYAIICKKWRYGKMCVIAISKPGKRLPTRSELESMWRQNPHGAGFMVARDGHVVIQKGFMTFQSFDKALSAENFSRSDSVIYHFRISTQAGVSAAMTQPFPVTRSLAKLKSTSAVCNVGIAHNGIIPLTTDSSETEYSDTALFISKYISKYLYRFIRSGNDILSPETAEIICALAGAGSRFALMNGRGEVATIGRFETDNGLLFSNLLFKDSYYSSFLLRYTPAERPLFHYKG
jgi:glutamine phosphoribosylpyrophosphate amidotransferase